MHLHGSQTRKYEHVYMTSFLSILISSSGQFWLQSTTKILE